MKKEDKKLLLIDLCGRLPYNFVYCYCNAPFAEGKPIVLTPVVISNLMNATDDLVIKPYLRPMSSMTEEEESEYHSLCYPEWNHGGLDGGNWHYHNTISSVDWLNAYYFDYRGLIEKDLAIEATEDMYK